MSQTSVRSSNDENISWLLNPLFLHQNIFVLRRTVGHAMTLIGCQAHAVQLPPYPHHHVLGR